MNRTKEKLNKKIRKGDRVLAIAGNFRGQTGTVMSRRGEQVVVQGLNLRKKHVKRSEANPRGGIVELEKPIHVSNLMVCTADNKPMKLKVKQAKDGTRELYYKDEGKAVVYRSIKQSSNQ